MILLESSELARSLSCNVNCVLNPESIENLPKLVEDIVQTSINTGPRGVLRLAQGLQAVVGVGQEWLQDVSKVTCAIFVLLPYPSTYYPVILFYKFSANDIIIFYLYYAPFGILMMDFIYFNRSIDSVFVEVK